MKIAIIGASVGVGLETTRRALEVGHHVTTLSRSIESLPQHVNLTAIQGSALNAPDVSRTIADADVVLITLGTGNSTKATSIYTDATKTILASAAASKLTAPVIAVTGFGAGASSEYQNPLIRTLMRVMLGKVYANKSEMEQMLTSSLLRWEIVRPGRLTDTPGTGAARVITRYTKGMKVGSVSRADVARYLVDEAANPRNLGEYPALTN